MHTALFALLVLSFVFIKVALYRHYDATRDPCVPAIDIITSIIFFILSVILATA